MSFLFRLRFVAPGRAVAAAAVLGAPAVATALDALPAQTVSLEDLYGRG